MSTSLDVLLPAALPLLPTRFTTTLAPDNPQTSIALRRVAFRLIDAVAAKKLKFPVASLCAARMLYVRFFAAYSLEMHNWYDVVVAAVVLAGKICETAKKVREVLIAVAAVVSDWVSRGEVSRSGMDMSLMEGLERRFPADADSAEFEKTRIRAIGLEKSMLRLIRFDVDGFALASQAPWKCVVMVAIEACCAAGAGMADTRRVARLAWSILKSCHDDEIVLTHPIYLVSAACVITAAALLGTPCEPAASEYWRRFHHPAAPIAFADVCRTVLQDVVLGDGAAKLLDKVRDRAQAMLDNLPSAAELELPMHQALPASAATLRFVFHSETTAVIP